MSPKQGVRFRANRLKMVCMIFHRYLSNESTPIKAYGFVDIDFNKELSVIEHQAGSYYFFIPQVNLHVCNVAMDVPPPFRRVAYVLFPLRLVKSATVAISKEDASFDVYCLNRLSWMSVKVFLFYQQH